MKINVLLLLAIVAITSGTYTPRTRDYYIGAIEVDWDYVPTGQDLIWGGQYGEFEEFSMRTMYRKAVYREFTDATFTTRMFRGPDEQHLGILGPTIRGVVGDTLRVHFMNMASFPFSVTSPGVTVDKANEGAVYVDESSGIEMQDDEIQPGDNFTYIWRVTEDSAPRGDDVSSIAYPYHSMVKEINDLNSGLFGSVIITRADRADPETARPTDVDREFVVLFHIFNERLSLYNEVNGINASSPEGDVEKSALNGLIFGNLRGLNTTINETVRWYVMGAGFFHAPSWHGNTLIWDNRRVVTVIVGPGVALTLTQRELNAGTWLFYCHVEEHALEGMATTYTVSA